MSQSNLLPSERTSGALRSKRERETAPTIDLLAWLYLYREKFGWIILGLVVMPALAFLYLSVARKMYTAQCVVQVESEERLLSGKHDVSPEDEFKTIEALRTVEGALSSRSLLLRVVKANTLDKVHPDYSAKPGRSPLTDSELADIMQRRVDVSLRRGTRLIDITAEDPNPQRAAMLASSVVNEYIKLNFEQKSEAARLANEALYRQRDELKEKLQKTEEALQTYREQFGVVSLDMGSDGKQSSLQNSNSDKLKELNRQLQEVRSDRIKLEGLLPVAKRASKLSVDELLAVEPIAKAQDVIESQKLLAAKEEEFGEIKKRYLQLH
ncbi:MAG: hypothetical protein EBU88_20040, partial [Acidobacteria bacterium]|nr:hypothetical protein [Acidobacteriota bacterium]